MKTEIIERDIVKDIKDFIQNKQKENILYIYGASGVGKSSLAKWLSINYSDKIILFIDFAEQDEEDELDFTEFFEFFVSKENLNFFYRFIAELKDLESDEEAEGILDKAFKKLKGVKNKFSNAISGFFLDTFDSEYLEDAEGLKNIILDYFAYKIKKDKRDFEKKFWEFLKKHSNNLVLIIDTFEEEENVKILSSIKYVNKRLKERKTPHYYSLRDYLFKLIEYTDIKTLIFSRISPFMFYTYSVSIDEKTSRFLNEFREKIKRIELKNISNEEILRYLKLKDLVFSKEEISYLRKIVKGNFAILRLILSTFREEKKFNKDLTLKEFFKGYYIGQDKTGNFHFLIQFLLNYILRGRAKELKNIEHKLIQVVLLGNLTEKIREGIPEKYIDFFYRYGLITLDRTNKVYTFHQVIREALIFKFLNSAINFRDFESLYNISQENVKLLEDINETKNWNYLLNKIIASKIEEKEIKFDVQKISNALEEFSLFFPNETFPYLNFYLAYQILRKYPFMSFDEKSILVDLLYKSKLEKGEIYNWLILFRSFYEKGWKIWEDLRNEIMDKQEGNIQEIDYLGFLFLAGYRHYKKALKRYRENFKYKEGFKLFDKVIKENLDNIENRLEKILRNKNIDLNNKYKVIGLLFYFDRKTKEKKAVNILENLIKRNPNNIILNLSKAKEFINKNKIEKAKKIVMKYEKMSNSFAFFYYLKSKILYSEGKKELAINEFSKGLKYGFYIFKYVDFFSEEEIKQVLKKIENIEIKNMGH